MIFNLILIKFVLVSNLIAYACLAAKKLDPNVVHCNVPSSKGKVDGLKTIILEKYPELFPPFLVSCKDWDRDLAIAFALGLALGKQCEQLDTSTNAECEMIEWKYVGTAPSEGNRITARIINLSRAVSANLEWKDGSQTYNPITELFSIEKIQNVGNDSNYFVMVRHLLAYCAEKAIAMVAIDVALLKWMVHAIKANPLKCNLLEISESIFMPLCALSMIPQVGEHCTDDILTVLTEVQKYADPETHSSSDMDNYNPTLFTLYKMLDDGPIRRKVEEIVEMVCHYSISSYLSARMILGDDHSIVRATEEKFSDEERSLRETLFTCQAECHRKVYSIGNRCINGHANSRVYPQNNGFIQIYMNTTLSAVVEQDNTLKWEGTTPALGQEIIFSNDPSPHPKRLFIINQLLAPIPLQFWQDITSCTSITQFQEIMKKPVIRQIILTYGLTILESSSIYEFKPSVSNKNTSGD